MACRKCGHLETEHGSGGVCFKEVRHHSDQKIPIGCECMNYKK